MLPRILRDMKNTNTSTFLFPPSFSILNSQFSILFCPDGSQKTYIFSLCSQMFTKCIQKIITISDRALMLAEFIGVSTMQRTLRKTYGSLHSLLRSAAENSRETDVSNPICFDSFLSATHLATLCTTLSLGNVTSSDFGAIFLSALRCRPGSFRSRMHPFLPSALRGTRRDRAGTGTSRGREEKQETEAQQMSSFRSCGIDPVEFDPR